MKELIKTISLRILAGIVSIITCYGVCLLFTANINPLEWTSIAKASFVFFSYTTYLNLSADYERVN